MREQLYHRVQFVISAGTACRSAFHIQRLYMRKFSSPCDWMMRYSLTDFLEVLASRGEQMFQLASIDPVIRGVVDRQNGMLSLNDFDCDSALEPQLPAFYEKMKRRAQNTIRQIEKSHCVGIVMHRDVSRNELINFANALTTHFPSCKFHIVNIKDTPTLSTHQITLSIKTEHYSVREICFNDEHPNGRLKEDNPSFWIGDENSWTKILKTEFHVKGRHYYMMKSLLKHYFARIRKKLKSKVCR